jgi:hypothetical protein
MMKRVTLVLLVALFCGAVAVLAAPPASVSGKIASVGDGQVQIAIDGDKPAWVKKNTPVKFTNGVGKILEVSAEDVTPVVITVKTKLAATLKVDDVVTFEKGRSMAGC